MSRPIYEFLHPKPKEPKRVRLLMAVKKHLYDQVKTTLATDKEIKAIKGLNSRIEKYYDKGQRGK